jgi:hypothetical protein
MMFRQENQGSPVPTAPEMLPHQAYRKSRRKLYAAILAVITVIVIVISVILVPAGGTVMNLSLNYDVGERMVYQTTSVMSSYSSNSTLEDQSGGLTDLGSSQSSNSTLTMDVIALNGEVYTVNETITSQPALLHLPTLSLSISKNELYNNFMAPGGPLIFYNNTNPTVLAYLSQSSAKVGDVWTLPVSTGNSSLGLTGQVTIAFAGIEEITVPAGTYKVMRIEVASDTLHIRSDGTGILTLPAGMTLQFNGTTYLEQSTCRLIKATLSQTGGLDLNGANRTTTMYTEKILTQYTKP